MAVLSLPRDFNPLNEDIVFAFLDDEFDSALPPWQKKYVRWARPMPAADVLASADRELDVETPRRWEARYGCMLPSDAFHHCYADTLVATAIPYDGPTQLGPAEQQLIFLEGRRLSVAMLYVMIEGLGWRPGGFWQTQVWPARETLLTALDVWKDEDPCGSLEIALSMYTAGCGTGEKVVRERVWQLVDELTQQR